ncbi:MAG: PHP domain-containing protein [Lachnospiraceae bacterium]|nr:PHP domain-containing protein [Lachnospiraceae bacterium]
MNGYIDLHVHSNYSDGTLSPYEILDLAIETGLVSFALTDHDTVDGVPVILDYMNSLKQNHPSPYSDSLPIIIPGVELSCAFDGPDLHILGLNIDYKSEKLLKRLRECQNSRSERNSKMIKNMQKLGFDISEEKIYALYGKDVSITRAHFARYLTDMGYTASKDEAFDKYLGFDGPVYVKREKLSPEEAITLILEAGGHPVLAHPLLYKCDDTKLNELLKRLKSSGLHGLEAIYSLNTPEDDIYLKNLADKYELFITGGSDFHGTNKPDIKLGVGKGNLRIPAELLKNIISTLLL